MRSWALQPRAMLRVGLERGPGAFRVRELMACIVIAGAVYGAAMGTYGSEFGLRPLQVLYSAVKVPMLLLVTFALTLPAAFTASTLLGLREDWPTALRALLATQAVVALVLASFSPFTLVCYASTGSYQVSQLFNLGMFGAASFTGQAVLRRCYRPLVARRKAHGVVMWSWLGVYAFVGVQMGWVLRPFLGKVGGPTQFFRDEPFSNAYVVVLRIVGRVLEGS